MARLAYIDPPFNSGRTWRTKDGKVAYRDVYDDYLAFLMPRIKATLPHLTADGSLFVHLDYRHVHEVKVALDALLGRGHFIREIIWAYDYGGRSRKRWPAKHQTILWYATDPTRWVYNPGASDRLPYLALGLAGPEKATRGKLPTDVWWISVAPTSGPERTGYPTQKPLKLLERIVRVHSSEGDVVLDPFAGSGTTAAAAAKHGRDFILIDQSQVAVEVMRKRLSGGNRGTA